jgi:hypothetical protein
VGVLSYQHANDGDEGDDLGHAPEGEEEAAQHVCYVRMRMKPAGEKTSDFTLVFRLQKLF